MKQVRISLIQGTHQAPNYGETFCRPLIQILSSRSDLLFFFITNNAKKPTHAKKAFSIEIPVLRKEEM